MSAGISAASGLLWTLPVDVLGHLLDDSDLSQDGWAFRFVLRLTLCWKHGKNERELLYGCLARLDLGSFTENLEAHHWKAAFKSVRHLLFTSNVFGFITNWTMVTEIVKAVSPHLQTFSWLWYTQEYSAPPFPRSLLEDFQLPHLETLEFRFTKSAAALASTENMFRGLPKLKNVRMVAFYDVEQFVGLRNAFRPIEHQIEEITIRFVQDQSKSEEPKVPVDQPPADVEESAEEIPFLGLGPTLTNQNFLFGSI